MENCRENGLKNSNTCHCKYGTLTWKLFWAEGNWEEGNMGKTLPYLICLKVVVKDNYSLEGKLWPT